MNDPIPPSYLITGEPEQDPKKFLARLEKALNRGIKLVQVRAKSLTKNNYEILAIEAVKLCHQYGAIALLNSYLDLIRTTKAEGVHLPSKALMSLNKRPISYEHIFSAACHNFKEIQQAKRVEADFITLSPVYDTPCCPDKSAMGWEKFAELVTLANLPVYALGGMTLEHLSHAQSHGAVGIAATRGLWPTIPGIC